MSVLQAKQIEVCKSCAIKSIKEAIEIAENGDEILIKKGLYKEHGLIVNKSIALIGEEGTIIDGEEVGGIFTCEADNFTIKNLKIINVGASYTVDYAAIKVVKVAGFIIENCTFESVFFGILIEKSENGIIRNNKITSNRKS